MNTLNIFSNYKQEENHFTNSLISLLSMSRHDSPEFVASFLREVIRLEYPGDIDTFRVLKEYQGTADAELSSQDCCLRLETKIVSGTLREDQIHSHLKYLQDSPKSFKKLMLLTPDDSQSAYIQQFLALDPDVVHVEWREVLDFLNKRTRSKEQCLFFALVDQLISRIQDNILNQDMAGIVLKVDFGKKSGVDPAQYLNEMKAWTHWNTPRQYQKLDGTGRKLMLYDRTRKAIMLDVEIQKVCHSQKEQDYPWTNEFVPGSVRFFDPPIQLSDIQKLPGFDNFSKPKKDRSPYRNLTRSLYRELTQGQSDIPGSTATTPSTSPEQESDQFILQDRCWYAAEIIGEEFGTEIRSYSPIHIHSIQAENLGRRRFTLSFYHANYPEGVRDKVYTLQEIERTRTYLLARSTEHTPTRLMLIYPISGDWLTKHFGTRAPSDLSDVQIWLSKNF